MATYKNPISLIPKFEFSSNKNASDFMTDCQFHISNLGFQVKMIDSHIFVDINSKNATIWSPQLHLQVIEQQNSLKVNGKFSPKPQVWTLFMFFHFIIGSAFLGFLMKAIADYILQQFSLLAVIMLVILPILWFTLYVIGIYGKEKSRSEMDLIYTEIQKCL